MTQRIDLYRMGCVAVGLLGLFMLFHGVQQGLVMVPLSMPMGGILILISFVFVAVSVIAPGAALIYYRRQITGNWLLPEVAPTNSESVTVATGTLSISLLGIYFAANGVIGLASGLA